jgi:sugar phosphate isomerase/epimerase
MLIVSRRQIECAEQGGGYVNNWTTDEFADYVRRRDSGGWVLLCRDHGGPWQNYPEVAKKMSVADAMRSAKHSFTTDLEAGFDVIHIDPSVPPAGQPDGRGVLEMLFELYDHVVETAGHLRQSIQIEVGTEEQNGGLNSPEELDTFLGHLSRFTRRRNYPMPVFVVAQTGTLVRETRNVGMVARDQAARERCAEGVRQVAAVARKYGVYIKEHNGDYLAEEWLADRPRLGIAATNIAPEFGVVETKHLIASCERLDLHREVDEFMSLALASNKWVKWLMPNSSATDRDKGVMAGHYVFAQPEFEPIFERMREGHARAGEDLDRALRDRVKASILRVMRPMGLVRG